MKRASISLGCSAFALALMCGMALADDLVLMGNTAPAEGAELSAVDAFKKDAPWRIGFSHHGLANTYQIQVSRDIEYEASKNPNIKELLFRNADWSQAKQVADIEDLIAEGIDALIVSPVTLTSADAGIEKAVAAGIPVVIHSGDTSTQAYTSHIVGGGVHFGKAIGEWIVDELDGKGNIWVLRGIAGHPEDTSRYQGLVEAIEGTEVKIAAEDYGNWAFDGGRLLCESFLLSNPDVDAVWSSGADMSRACVEVFIERGVAVPRISGEANNGFLRFWRENNLTAVAPEYGPEQGAAALRAAVALLEGKQVSKTYFYNPPAISIEQRDALYRPDLSDAYWFPTALPEEKLKEYYGEQAQ